MGGGSLIPGGINMGTLKSTLIAVCLFCAASAQAEELIRKGGEWQVTTTGVTPQPQTMTMCFAASTAQQAMAKLAARPNCTKTSANVSGNIVTFDIACGALTMQGTATFSGDSAYTGDLTMHMGGKVIHALSDAKWIGACKPGETPR
jgi:Protein of unknown function (DUF3617)